jgi:hypothetical protein
MLTSEFGFKITPITNFSNYITIPIRSKNLKASQNIRMIKLLQNLNLREKEFLQFLRLERIKLDNFDRNNLI